MQIRDLKKGDYVLTKQLGTPVKSKLLESPRQGKGIKKVILVFTYAEDMGLFNEHGSIPITDILKVKKDNNWINVEVQDISITDIDRHNNESMLGIYYVSHETFINKENKMIKLYNMFLKNIVITERVKQGLEDGTITDEEVYNVIKQKNLIEYVDILEEDLDAQPEDIDITLNSIDDMRRKRGF